ncbi:unnamed protein product [Leuciscus chuanchicus]
MDAPIEARQLRAREEREQRSGLDSEIKAAFLWLLSSSAPLFIGCVSVSVTQTLSDNNVTVIGLLTDGEEAAYREEVKTLAIWCQENNISLNKTKEMITDYKKHQAGANTPIFISYEDICSVRNLFTLSVSSALGSKAILDPEARPPLVENTLEEGACSCSAAQINVLCVLKTDSHTLSLKGSVK